MTTTKQRVRNAVRADRWDQIEYETSRDRLDRLPELIEQVAEVNWTAPPLIEDIWQALYQQFPRRAEGLDPAYRPNAAALDELENSEAWRDLKPLCVDDRTAAGMGTLAMRSQLLEVAQRLHTVQDKADEAQTKLDEYRDAADHDGADPALVSNRLAAYEAARDAADDALDGQMPGIGKAMRLAAAGAAAAAQQEAENAAGWGITNPGELAAMDPASRIALGEQMATPQMRKVMEKVGQLKNLYFGEHQKRLDPTPDEIHDIELGDDLGRMLSSELAGLVIPELEDDFYRRLVEHQIQIYELTSTEKVGRGGLLYLEDSSLSMNIGDRTVMAKGLGLSLEAIARSEKRSFEAFLFGGPGQVTAWPCTTVKDRLAYASAFLAAGDTDWMSPLNAAVRRLDAEFAETGKISGDIVLATDGDCDVSDKWLTSFKEARARLGFKVYSVAIGQPPTPMLEKVSDFVAEIVDLVTCSDVHAVFRRL